MQSVLTKKQTKEFTGYYEEDGQKYKVVANVRYDDECNNGHNTFAITGDVYRWAENGRWAHESCGCVHEDITKALPELSKYIKWHLTDSSAPLHYIANTLYFAGNRDYNGLLKGESVQLRNRHTNELCWKLDDNIKLEKYIDSNEQPQGEIVLKYVPWCKVGEGKEREFDAARETAIWPEATDEQLSLPKEELKTLLMARHEGLMKEFKEAMLELGFIY